MHEHPIDRFTKYIRITDDFCWEWTGAVTSTNRSRRGYGNFHAGKSNVYAHRWLYEYLIGPVPDGLQLDHLCENSLCVNPEHLEPVSARENLLRSSFAPAGINARKTQCKRGHEFTPENTHTYQGERRCRACQRQTERERYAKRKQATRKEAA